MKLFTPPFNHHTFFSTRKIIIIFVLALSFGLGIKSYKAWQTYQSYSFTKKIDFLSKNKFIFYCFQSTKSMYIKLSSYFCEQSTNGVTKLQQWLQERLAENLNNETIQCFEDWPLTDRLLIKTCDIFTLK